jgi:hypothetical protein
MKKALYIVFTVFALIIVILIAVPLLFKDKILAKVDREIAATVNAHVFYDYDKVGLSFFRSFPHISATIGDFGIVGNPPFEKDTLVQAGQFQVDFNIFSVLFGEDPELTGLHLIDGNIFIKVLADGAANYDIMFPSDEEEELSEESSEFKIGIRQIEVKNLGFIYDDREMGFYMALAGMDINGSGDFTSDVYDLSVAGGGNLVRLDYDEFNYITQKKIAIDTDIKVDLENMVFGLQHAKAIVNEFAFGLDGSIGLPEEGVALDLTFFGEDNSFKSILSLVPGMYTSSFDGLRTSGTMDFKGFVKGMYSEEIFPSFQMGLQVNEGMFQYPDLPRPVQRVNIDLLVDNPTGNLERTEINLSAFNLQFGEQPVSGRFYLKDLINYEMDGQLIGQLDLSELTSVFPVEGMELRGNLSIDAKAKGRYDSIARVIPAIDARINLSNGYVRSTEYPAPIEKLDVISVISNTTGRMNDLLVDVSRFGFELEGEPITGHLRIQDLDQLNWDFSIHGGLDFGKLIAIFPMEDVILEGKIKADIDSKGSYADVEAGRYNRLATSGDLEVVDLFYADLDLHQGIRIRQAAAVFSPNEIRLNTFDARFGESPVSATGSLSNYMDFFIGGTEAILRGNLALISSRFNVNEWMASSDSNASGEAMQVIELPRNIDFTMSVVANEILYDNLVLNNAKGTMNLRDGVLSFRDFGTETLGGQMAFSGTYNSQDVKSPLFDFTFDVSSLSIQEAFSTFNTVRTFAPIAAHITGNFATNFKLSGVLGQDMMPVLSSLDGKGLIKLAETAIRDSQLIRGITSITRLNDTATLSLRPFNIQAEIQDGMLKIPPFDLMLWDYQAKVQGSTGFDGSINYLVSMQVPVEKFGSQVNSLIAGLAGTDLRGTTVPLAFNIGGTYNSPNVGLASGDNLETYLTGFLRSRASAASSNIQDNLAAEFKAREDSLRQEIKQKAEVAKDSVRSEAERIVEESKDKAKEEVKNVLRNLTRPRPQNQPDPQP